MKQLFAMILFAAFGVANAQTEQGGWLVGASTDLSFTSTSIDGADDNLSSFELSTRAGYFLIDNLVAGLDVSFQSEKEGDDKFSLTVVGPFARYYVGGTFFVGAGYGAASAKDDDDDAVKGGLLALEAGYPIWMGDNVALEPSLNYGIGSGDLFEDVSTFGLAVGFSLYF